MSQKKAEGIKFRTGRAGGPTAGLSISEFHQLRQQLGTGGKKKEEFPGSLRGGLWEAVWRFCRSLGYTGGGHLCPQTPLGAWKMRPYMAGPEAPGAVARAAWPGFTLGTVACQLRDLEQLFNVGASHSSSIKQE